jgi:hypothetical protein
MLRSAAVLPLMLCVACGGANDRASRTEVVDSGGVQLVRNGGQVDTVTLQPDLTIGTVDGPEELQFFRVSALAVTPDGGVLVGDGSGTIRHFDSAGAFVRRFGRRGAGPGEFQRPSAIHIYGDTTAVVDVGLFRITEFDAGGAVLGTIPLRQERTIVFPTARANGGWLVQRVTPGWNLEIGKARRDTARVLFADLTQLAPPDAGNDDGAETPGFRPVVEYETGRTFGIHYEMNGRSGMTANSPLWEPSPSHAVDGAGNIYVAHGAPYRIDVFDADGVRWRSITRDHTPVPAAGDLNDRYWDKVNTYLDTTSNRHGEWSITVAAERGRADLPVNETLPALGRLIVSDEGVLWANRPDLAPDPLLLEWSREGTRQDTFWDVFDHEGRFLMTARLPAAFRPMSAAQRSMYGVLRDDMDVEHIARFTLPARD